MQRMFAIGVILMLGAVTLWKIFYRLPDTPVAKWDEQTNIAVVTESLSRGSFPFLYLYGKPFFEKPPLWYMTTAGVVILTSESVFSMRLVSAVAGLGIIFLTVFVAWQQWGMLAGIASWIVLLGSNQLFTANAGGYFSTHTFRSADGDAQQIFLMVLGFAATAYISSDRRMSIIAGIASGLALLTKGPMGLMPLVAATVLVLRSPKTIRHSVRTAWILFFCTVLPWYLFMTIRFGFPFLGEHFGYHMIDRAFFALEGHTAAPWYYLLLLSDHALFFSWELLIAGWVWVIVRKLYRDPRVLSVSILATGFLIIPSLMATKLAWYILPFYPFAALLIGAVVSDVSKRLGIMQ